MKEFKKTAFKQIITLVIWGVVKNVREPWHQENWKIVVAMTRGGGPIIIIMNNKFLNKKNKAHNCWHNLTVNKAVNVVNSRTEKNRGCVRRRTPYPEMKQLCIQRGHTLRSRHALVNYSALVNKANMPQENSCVIVKIINNNETDWQY